MVLFTLKRSNNATIGAVTRILKNLDADVIKMDLSKGCKRGKNIYGPKLPTGEDLFLPIGKCTKTLQQAVFELDLKHATQYVDFYHPNVSSAMRQDLIRQELNRLEESRK